MAYFDYKSYMRKYRRKNLDFAKKQNERIKNYQKTKAGKASLKAGSLNTRSKKRGANQKITGAYILALWEAQPICNMCGKDNSSLQIDHIKPIHLGGENQINNLQRLCAECHKEKTRVEKMLKTQPQNIPDWFWKMIEEEPQPIVKSQLKLF